MVLCIDDGASSVSTEELIESLNAIEEAKIGNNPFDDLMQHNADNLFYIQTRNEMERQGFVSNETPADQPYFRRFEKRGR